MIPPATMGHLIHPYRPDVTGTQCSVSGCWGWVDDPRHLGYGARPSTPGRVPSRYRNLVSPGHRWDDYGRCDFPPCSAAPGKPCTTTSGKYVGDAAKEAHHGRPRQSTTAANPGGVQ